MTEQMAQKWLEQFEFPTDENSDDALATICEALQEYPKFKVIGTVEEINAKLAELERWHKSEVDSKIKNVFANTSTSICHNCDHKDEYIEELETEVEELKALKEKSVAKSPKRKYVKCGKHKWKRRENGEVDDWAWDYNYCNGVVCDVCGKTVCVHCIPNYDDLEDCEIEDYICPTCGEIVEYEEHHCKCGQRFDWE